MKACRQPRGMAAVAADIPALTTELVARQAVTAQTGLGGVAAQQERLHAAEEAVAGSHASRLEAVGAVARAEVMAAMAWRTLTSPLMAQMKQELRGTASLMEPDGLLHQWRRPASILCGRGCAEH